MSHKDKNMKISKNFLKKIIQEEVKRIILSEISQDSVSAGAIPGEDKELMGLDAYKSRNSEEDGGLEPSLSEKYAEFYFQEGDRVPNRDKSPENHILMAADMIAQGSLPHNHKIKVPPETVGAEESASDVEISVVEVIGHFVEKYPDIPISDSVKNLPQNGRNFGGMT